MKKPDTSIPLKRGQKRKKHGGGRPPKFSHDLVVSFCELLKRGLSRKDACNTLDISYQTMYVWLKRGALEKDLPKSRRTEFFKLWESVNNIDANIKEHGKYDDSSNSLDLTRKGSQEVNTRTEHSESAGSRQRKNAPVIPRDPTAPVAPRPATIESIVQYQSGIIQRTVVNNPFIKEVPTEKQDLFLRLGIPLREMFNLNISQGPNEVFFDGAIRTGKTYGLIMAALQYVKDPTYRALLLCSDYDSHFLSMMQKVYDIFRKKRPNLNRDAVTWNFSSGAKLSLGYLHQREDNKKFTIGKYQFIGCDDLTSFTEKEYLELFSHLLLPAPKSTIPLRIFSTGNASGMHPEWVKERFITPSRDENAKSNRFVVSVSLDENPHINPAFYRDLPVAEDLLMRAQLLYNDWDTIDQAY